MNVDSVIENLSERMLINLADYSNEEDKYYDIIIQVFWATNLCVT